MIIMVGTKCIHPESISCVVDNRKNESYSHVRVGGLDGCPLLELEDEEADLFMSQYFMYANNRNRQFEMAYSQTIAYYEQMRAIARRNEEATFVEAPAKDGEHPLPEGWLAPGTDKPQ